MRLWQGKGGAEPPEADLAFLTRTQAVRLRKLFRQAMAERGRELGTDSLGNFRDDEGNYYGLWNLAVLCRDDPGGEKGWPRLVAGYADAVLKGHSRESRAQAAALTPEDARSLVYLSLRSATAAESSIDPLAPEVAPGLVELLTLDMPHNTVFLDGSRIARFGGRASLREAALANLRALPVPEHQTMGTPDAHFVVIRDDSHFTASRVLIMPDLLSQILRTDAPHGVLAAMPARHWAFIHVLTDKTATASLLKMAAMARIVHGQEQGPISPEVFWWRDGGWALVPAAAKPDGKFVLRPGAELSFLLTDLAARPRQG